MASVTVRNLDDAIKAQLKLRAATHGRSVEEELRVILREAASDFTSPHRGEVVRHSSQSEGAAGEGVFTSFAPLPASGEREQKITLIIGGGIAAYKSLDLIRRLKERDAQVRVVLTRAAQHFVTPLSASALAHSPVSIDLFDARSEFDAGHIRLARECDLIVVAPATADLMAKMANGHADDLASAILLASNRPVLLAPAMNPLMWSNAATRRNLGTLLRDGVRTIGPNAGEMAERNEAGTGRMAEPIEIAQFAMAMLTPARPAGALKGKRVLITAGPTHEPIDPVRYIANRSSGKQGFAIATSAATAGADVTLISGPVTLPDPTGVRVIRVEAAREMLKSVEAALPADIAIFAAAVADWRVASEGTQKIKKTSSGLPPLDLVENPDILATIAKLKHNRPPLVIGFAAETEHLIDHAMSKLLRKGCDWIIANDVSPAGGVLGGDRNTVHLLMRDKTGGDAKIESWDAMPKDQVADALVARIVKALRDSVIA